MTTELTISAARVTIKVRSRASDCRRSRQLIWIEELIAVAEASASAPVYALLKREDERHVTMQAYDNPVFVEDIVRNVAATLQARRTAHLVSCPRTEPREYP